MMETQQVEVKEYHEHIKTLFDDGYEMMVDLTAVDWFRKKEPRFEVVVNLLSLSKNERKMIKVTDLWFPVDQILQKQLINLKKFYMVIK